MATILYIEDHDGNFRLVQRIMTYTLQASVVQARTAKEAVQYAKEHSDIDLVLLDIQLPDSTLDDLPELISHLKSHVPTTKIIALTALRNKPDREKILSAGCDGYIAKPFIPQKMVMQIQSILNK